MKNVIILHLLFSSLCGLAYAMVSFIEKGKDMICRISRYQSTNHYI